MSNLSEIKLPTIKELYEDTEMSIKENALMVILNQPPRQEWTQLHPTTKQKYLPVERVEWLMSRIFTRWRIEIKSISLIANSVVCTLRVWYWNPVQNDWDWTEGTGACPLQTDKGAGATDFNALKNSSVQMAAPAAKSYAFKDACECLGKVFGKDLNRKDIDYNSLLKKEIKEQQLNNLHA